MKSSGRRPSKLLIAAVLTAAVLTAAVLNAGLSALQAPRPQTTFRTGVDYVRVDVVVTDGNDRPVTNLTRDDFEIVEDGQRQAIDDFEFVSVPTGSRLPDSTEPDAPAPDVATNAPPSTRSRLFALVIDDLHIVESEIVSVKQVMTEFIRTLSPDDEVAVVFVGRSDLSQNFTTDRSRLLRTVNRVRDSLGFGLDSLGRSSPSNVIQGDPRIMYEYARSADLVLKNVAMSLAGSSHPPVTYTMARRGWPDPASDIATFFSTRSAERAYSYMILGSPGTTLLVE